MEQENLSQLNDQELSIKLKKVKSNKTLDSVLIGATFGIVIFSAIRNGLGFFTFFPLIITYFIFQNSKKNKIAEQEIEQEIQSRQ